MIVSEDVGTAALGYPTGQRPGSRSELRIWKVTVLALMAFLLTPRLSASDCIPLQAAAQHIDETKCVTGKVVRVKVGPSGIHFLDFCEDQMACPFTVVIFSHDLKDVGDVRRLEGRTIEIRGRLKLYDGRPEIILNRIGQIEGGAAMIPPLPKSYDVENRGHYSAGRLHPTKKPAKVKGAPNTTATYSYDAEGDDLP